MLFQYTRYQFKKLSLYFLILLVLLVFNYYYEIYFDWGGVQLIVRLYIFVLSFFLIYNYTSEDEELYYRKYESRHGILGKIIFVIESRYLLFILIYCFSALFTITSYAGSENWPIMPILMLFDGRYSNTVFYALSFFVALKLRKHPFLTGSLFLGLAFSYYVFDHEFYNYYKMGYEISIYKITKMVILFLVPGYDYAEGLWKKIILLVTAAILAMSMYFINLWVYYANVKDGYFNHPFSHYSSDKLFKFGFTFHLDNLKAYSLKTANISAIDSCYRYLSYNEMKFNFSSKQWTDLLELSGNSPIIINKISNYVLYDSKTVNSKTISYIYYNIFRNDSEILNYDNFIRLYSLSVEDTTFLREEIDSSPKYKKIFIIRVFGYSGKLEAVPVLLKYLVSTDRTISAEAYNSLVYITGLDPNSNKFKKNAVTTYEIFKDYYYSNL